MGGSTRNLRLIAAAARHGDAVGGDADVRRVPTPAPTRPARRSRDGTSRSLRRRRARPATIRAVLDAGADGGRRADRGGLPSLTVPTSDDATPTRATSGARAPRRAGSVRRARPASCSSPTAGCDYVCSAAAIRTRKRNQVITAGHCVHTGPNVGLLEQPHFFSDWLFVPRYRNGRAPYGRWVGQQGLGVQRLDGEGGVPVRPGDRLVREAPRPHSSSTRSAATRWSGASASGEWGVHDLGLAGRGAVRRRDRPALRRPHDALRGLRRRGHAPVRPERRRERRSVVPAPRPHGQHRPDLGGHVPSHSRLAGRCSRGRSRGRRRRSARRTVIRSRANR